MHVAPPITLLCSVLLAELTSCWGSQMVMRHYLLLMVVAALAVFITDASGSILLQASPNPLMVGDRLTLTCIGPPAAQSSSDNVRMSVDGVTPSDRVELINGSNGTYTFNYVPLYLNESGTIFQCLMDGSQSNIITLVIYYAPLYSLPQLHPLINGSGYRLRLEISSLPYPNSSLWYRDGVQLVGYDVTPNTILFNPLMPYDNGTYTVTSSNIAGDGSLTFDIIVYYGPGFTEGNNITKWVEFETGSNFTLTCSVNQCNPCQYTLNYTTDSSYIDNIDVNHTSSVVTFTFTDAEIDNKGFYTCHSQSNFTNMSLTYWVFIGGPPDVHISLANVTIITDSVLIVDCIVNDKSNAPITGIIIDISPSIYGHIVNISQPMFDPYTITTTITHDLPFGSHNVSIGAFNDIATVSDVYIGEFFIPSFSGSLTSSIDITSFIVSSSHTSTASSNPHTSTILHSSTTSNPHTSSATISPTSQPSNNGGLIAAGILIPLVVIIIGTIAAVFTCLICKRYYSRMSFSVKSSSGNKHYENINGSGYESFQESGTFDDSD